MIAAPNPTHVFAEMSASELADSEAFAAAVYGVERAMRLLTGNGDESELPFVLALFAVSGFLGSNGADISEEAIRQLAEIRAGYEAACLTGAGSH